MKKKIKKGCETCRYTDDGEHGGGIIASCMHPRNKKFGMDNLEWAFEKCLDKRYKYWKERSKV